VTVRLGLTFVSLLALGVAWLLWTPIPHSHGVDPGAWEAYRTRYISADGRVVDTGNNNVSHSEGQGFGMLLAVAARDRATFDELWTWTRTHLRVRQDALCAWRWVPGQAGSGVADLNNATDGDLYLAWALLRAGRLWGGDYEKESQRIRTAVRTLLVRHASGYTVLLPGVVGFDDDHGLTLNLSYWLFPALNEFSEVESDPVWKDLKVSGLTLLKRARFGRWQLPPDWVLLTADGDLRLAGNRPPRFGFDAIRIPLLLKWGQIDKPDLYQPYQALRESFADRGRPGWVDLRTDAIAEYSASVGADYVLGLSGPRFKQNMTASTTPLPTGLDYYGASLWLLGQLASAETAR
jgi:endoglucanase